MTTNSFNTVLDHTSTAGFRAWGAELGVSFAAVGLVQTADTGQINWTTVTIPISNTVGGYEIWRYADSTLYVKIEYGTGPGAAIPQIWMTWGAGSNGSGTITGAATSSRVITSTGVAVASTVTLYTTYVCHTANAFSLVWKVNAVSSVAPYGYLCSGKTVDASGASTTVGFGVLRCSVSTGSPSLQSVRLTSVAAQNFDTVNFIVFPGNPNSSQTGTNIQAYLCWLNVHQVAPFAWACGYLLVEQLKVTPFSVNIVSTPSHTYLPMGQLSGSSAINGQSTSTYSLALIYE